MTDVEKPPESPKTSPSEAQALTEKVGVFLGQLRVDVANESGAKKDALIQQRLDTLDRDQLDELAKQVHTTGEIIGAHVKILDLVDQRKKALRKQLEEQKKSAEPPAVPAPEKKDEGYMDMFKNGYERVKKTVESVWSSLKNFKDHPVESTIAGFTSAVAAFKSGWGWMREAMSKTFGSLAAVIDDALPDWLKPEKFKKGLNFLMGDYGVFQKIFTKRMVGLIPNDPKQSFSLEGVTTLYKQFNSNLQEPVPFDRFGDVVALYIRKHPLEGAGKPPVKVTQAKLEETAKYVSENWPKVLQELSLPAGVAAAPGTTPATPEQLTRTEVQTLTVNGVEVSKVDQNGETLLTMAGKRYRVKPDIAEATPTVSVTKIEKISNGTVAITGNLLLMFSGTVTVTEQELGRVAQAVVGGASKVEVNYRNSAGVENKQNMIFEVVS